MVMTLFIIQNIFIVTTALTAVLAVRIDGTGNNTIEIRQTRVIFFFFHNKWGDHLLLNGIRIPCSLRTIIQHGEWCRRLTTLVVVVTIRRMMTVVAVRQRTNPNQLLRTDWFRFDQSWSGQVAMFGCRGTDQFTQYRIDIVIVQRACRGRRRR